MMDGAGESATKQSKVGVEYGLLYRQHISAVWEGYCPENSYLLAVHCALGANLIRSVLILDIV